MTTITESCRAVLATCLTDSASIPVAVSSTREEMYPAPYNLVFKAIRDLFVSGTEVTASLLISSGIDKDIVYNLMLLGDGNIALQTRDLRQLCITDIIRKEFSTIGNTQDIVTEFYGKVNRISSEAVMSSSSGGTMDNAARDAIVKITENKEAGISILGFPTKHKKFNNVTEGFLPGLSILQGRPGAGKTTIAIDLMRDQAKRGLKVGFISLEMTAMRIVTRIMADEIGVDRISLMKGHLMDSDMAKVSAMPAYPWMKNIHIEAFPGNTTDDVVSSIYKLRGKGCSIIFIDHLHHMSDEKMRHNPERMYTEIARSLSDIGAQQDFPIIALAQTSRGVENRAGDKRPLASDIKYAGSIEELSEIIMSAYRPSYYGLTEDDNGMPLPDGFFELIIRKNRETGVTGILPMIKIPSGLFEMDSMEATNHLNPPSYSESDIILPKRAGLNDEDLPF